MNKKCSLVCALLASCLCACAVGPSFERPTFAHEQRYTREPALTTITTASGEPAQHILVGAGVAAQWWKVFGSAAIDQVVADALHGSPSLAAARANLRAAEAALSAANGGLFPQLDVSLGAARRKGVSLQGANTNTAYPSVTRGPFNLFSLGGAVSYPLDVFGGVRRGIEQQQALRDNQHYQLATAYITLTGNAVSLTVNSASLHEQLRASQEVIQNDVDNAALVQEEYDAGKVPWTDVLSARTQLASDQTTLPPLRQQLSAAEHALAVLTGHAPSAWSAPELDLSSLVLPRELPLTLPSTMARQRPDILAAEAQLHADSAAIGVATAQLYPNLTLSASLGQQSFTVGSIFDVASNIWSAAAALTAPLFHGGTLRAKRRQALANYEASFATYQQVVLQGLQQVADTLLALAHDAELLSAEHQLLDAATQTLDLQKISYKEGKSGIVNLIDAQRSYQQARLGYVRAQAQRLQDSAQLMVALGGGWWKEQRL